jgi:hypothetical protein
MCGSGLERGRELLERNFKALVCPLFVILIS